VCSVLTLIEFCYAIVYMDKHGRDLKDPWSLRQLGVYNEISDDFSRSHCVLLDLAKHAEPHLREFVEASPGRSRLAFHIELLLHLGSNWTEYIEYLEMQLREHVSQDLLSIGVIDIDENRTQRLATPQLIVHRTVLVMCHTPISRNYTC